MTPLSGAGTCRLIWLLSGLGGCCYGLLLAAKHTNTHYVGTTKEPRGWVYLTLPDWSLSIGPSEDTT